MLPRDKAQAIPADIGKTIKPIPVIDNVTEVAVAPKKQLCLLILILCLEFYSFYISFLVYGFYLRSV